MATAAPIEGSDVAALRALASAEMTERRYDEAIAALERIAALRPDAGVHADLAHCHYWLGRLEPALLAARAALALQPGRAGTLLVMAAVLHGLGRYDEALLAALEAVRLDPANDVACARAGSTLERLGRLPEAEAQFRRAEDLAAGKPYSLVTFDRRVLEGLTAWRKDLVPVPSHRYGPRESTDRGLVALACCDSAYFSRYGYNFVSSFAHNAAENALLHVHVIDPAADLDRTIEQLAREFPSAELLFTTEDSPFAGRDVGAAGHTYYACCRFLQLPGLLARHRKPIVCLDIDAIVEQPLQALVASGAGGDVVLTRREPSHSPWIDILAGLVVANATAAAARYFELVRDYIVYFMSRRQFRWHLDQAALYCVLSVLERYGDPRRGLLRRGLERLLPGMAPRLPRAPRVTWLPSSAEGPVWQIGHSYTRRLEEPRFTRYSPAATQAPR
jgi:tetratricopeptide (TPR) repeat protein